MQSQTSKLVKCKFLNLNGSLRSVIITKKLILRSFEVVNEELSKKDFELTKSLYCDSDIMRYVDSHIKYSTTKVSLLVNNWKHSWRSNNPASCWIAYERPKKIFPIDYYLNNPQKLELNFVGFFMLDPGFKPGSIELGYVIKKSQWNKGYGLDGASAMQGIVCNKINRISKQFNFDFSFGYAKRKVPQINSLCATVSPANLNSIAILDKLKFCPYPLESITHRINLKSLKIELGSLVSDNLLIQRRIGLRNGMKKYFFIKKIKTKDR